MAAEREPPPLGDGRQTEAEELEDGEDLFTSTVSTLESSPSSPEPASLPAEDISTNSNGPKPAEIILDDDREDLFAAEPSVLYGALETVAFVRAFASVHCVCLEMSYLKQRTKHPEWSPKVYLSLLILIDQEKRSKREANGDMFDVEINVSDPEKVGDGMNAYMAYRVTTKTSLSMFHKNEFSVKRRFSDFLGLHSKLASKYLHR
uniref:Sorting nexin-2 n=1 Tax=Sphaerodactylus townsendi TaxID=933632 RepID=A0ACB8FMJ8_9SAUR